MFFSRGREDWLLAPWGLPRLGERGQGLGRRAVSPVCVFLFGEESWTMLAQIRSLGPRK